MKKVYKVRICVIIQLNFYLKDIYDPQLTFIVKNVKKEERFFYMTEKVKKMLMFIQGNLMNRFFFAYNLI